MILIDSLTADAKQQFSFPVAGYDNAVVYLEYKPMQYGWFISISWGNFVINNERVSTGPNLLRQWRDMIPFGIFIEGNEASEPLFQDSWVTTHRFYTLDEVDIVDVEGWYVR